LTPFSNRIRLFWWNEKIIQGKPRENYGVFWNTLLKNFRKESCFAWPKKSRFGILYAQYMLLSYIDTCE
jgi:hypothetical protein